MRKIFFFFLFLSFVGSVCAERVNMLQSGASNDGKKINTKLINNTINRLASIGGGELYFPAGIYLTGPIVLQSNITLNLESGAVLLFSDNFDHYLPFVEMRYEGVMMKSFSPLIYGKDIENVTIKGEGMLDGDGKAWWEEFFKVIIDVRDNGKRDINKYQPMWDKANADVNLQEVTNEDYHGILERRFFRPPFIQLLRSKNVRIEGVTIVDSPFWTINPQFCENVTVSGVTINNPDAPNTDGINPESCREVHISNCNISVGDDCITLKSGRDAQARELGVACENITITNCTMRDGHGGVVIGSEMSGGVKKVVISNCVFDGTDRGIRIKSTRGRGGVVEDIAVSNIVMRGIKKEAIVLNLFYSDMPEEPLSERTPTFRRIRFNNIIATDVVTAIRVAGIPENPVQDLFFSDIYIKSKKGVDIVDAVNVSFCNVRIDADSNAAFMLKDLNEAYFSNIRCNTPHSEYPLIISENTHNCCITSCFPMLGSRSFLLLLGEYENVVLINNAFGSMPILDKESVNATSFYAVSKDKKKKNTIVEDQNFKVIP